MERNSKLKTILRNGNSISISRYINLCLYEKNIGYYHNKKIGLDFTTSPEISQMFGECISIFMVSIFKKIGKVNNFCELGPGNGTLMKDLIKSLSAFLGNKINFFLFEKSNRFSVDSIFKDYKEFSVKKIKKLSFPSQPFFFFCNEFFDALPVNQFEKKNKKTFSVLKKQLMKVLEKKFNRNNIIIAYEPVWSIGTGKIPTKNELEKTILYIKKVLKSIFRKKSPAVLYGGSVDGTNVEMFKDIKEIDGFLIGGASKTSKKFIDIINNYYR